MLFLSLSLFFSLFFSFTWSISNIFPAKSCKCSRSLIVPFGQDAVYAVWFHIEAHCFTPESITWLGSRPMLSPTRGARGLRSRLHSRSRVPSVLLREPTYCAYICVPTNELGDPRSEPGNWNVRIKLAAHPSVVVCLYRSSSYPCLSFSLSCCLLPLLSFSLVTAISASGSSVLIGLSTGLLIKSKLSRN